jgi:hypothetical protein
MGGLSIIQEPPKGRPWCSTIAAIMDVLLSEFDLRLIGDTLTPEFSVRESYAMSFRELTRVPFCRYYMRHNGERAASRGGRVRG